MELNSMFTRAACLIGLLLLVACAGKDAVPRDWVGRWPGPEGTWLDISVADGVRESLRATDGAGTGMKWLAGKTTCLVVRPGEGFCRD
jgi:hypothetical protein